MSDIFCIALVFSRNHYRYQAYAREYATVLLALQKQVVIFSPDWISLNNYLLTHFKAKSNQIKCLPIAATENENPSNIELGFRYLKLSRQLKQVEKELQTKIECVFFAPIDDWIKPKLGKKFHHFTFPYHFTGLITQTQSYQENGLKLNVDPKFGESDYILSAENCIGLATLDRYKSEAIKSRIYKKVVVMPDISEYDLPSQQHRISNQIKRMAAGKMIVGTILLEDENPENFLQLASTADSDKYFFVCAGRVEPNQLSEGAQLALDSLLCSGKNNNYFILHDLEESEDINDLLNTFDVCYLNDGNFQLPHPLLSKAAYFHKPVVGSKNDMIGKLLRTFKTGIGVNGKISESIDAINILRMQMPFESNFDIDKLKNYAQLQSREALQDAFEELLLF